MVVHLIAAELTVGTILVPVCLFSWRRKSFDHHYSLIVEALAEPREGTVVGWEIVSLVG